MSQVNGPQPSRPSACHPPLGKGRGTRPGRNSLPPCPEPENSGLRFIARFLAGFPPFPFLSRLILGGGSLGMGLGVSDPPPNLDAAPPTASMAIVEKLEEQILYRLSLDPRARELARDLLERFRALVGDLPASEDHHHRHSGGLYQHSLEVGLKMLEEFEGNIIMERREDGSVDSFQSARNRPRWQYSCFLVALCHDLGKLFDVEVRSGEQRWFPLGQGYREFVDETGPASICWREDRERGAHAVLSCLLLHHLLTPEDLEYLGVDRVIHIVDSLAGTHARTQASPIARIVSKLDQASVEEAQSSSGGDSDSKIGHFLRAVTHLISTKDLGINFVGGQVYVMGERAAVVVPVAVNLARGYLRGQNIILPQNTHLYDKLRTAHLVEADHQGHSVRKIKVKGKQGVVSLQALIFSTDRVVPKDLLPTLPPIEFEIEPEAQTEGKATAHQVG